MIDGEVIAPGFELYSPDSEMSQINDKWLVTGCLPTDLRWQSVSHYDLEEYLVREGFLTPEQCDSESGQFFVYPASEEQSRAIGDHIAFLFSRVESFSPLPAFKDAS